MKLIGSARQRANRGGAPYASDSFESLPTSRPRLRLGVHEMRGDYLNANLLHVRNANKRAPCCGVEGCSD